MSWSQSRKDGQDDRAEHELDKHVTARHKEREAEAVVFWTEHPFICVPQSARSLNRRRADDCRPDPLYRDIRVEKVYLYACLSSDGPVIALNRRPHQAMINRTLIAIRRTYMLLSSRFDVPASGS